MSNPELIHAKQTVSVTPHTGIVTENYDTSPTESHD